MFLSFEKRLRRGTGVCTCAHNEDLSHQMCWLSNTSDRMYASTGALNQRSDNISTNTFSNESNQSVTETNKSTTNILKVITPLRCAPNSSSFRTQTLGTTTNLNSGHNMNCSTPLSLKTILRRQTSLGHLEGKSSTKTSGIQNVRNSEGPFGAFQQKIRSILSPSKESAKQKDIQTNVCDLRSEHQIQGSHQTQCSETTEYNEGRNSSPQLVNNYSTIRSANSETIERNNFEDENDSFYIRDVCSKWFGQKQCSLNQSLSMQMVSAVNKSSFSLDSPKLSHNMKSSLSEKVVKKESICQNSYIHTNNENNSVNAQPFNQIHLNERQNSGESDSNSITNDGHVVVVSSLENDTNLRSDLTVRPEFISNDVLIQSNSNSLTACMSAQTQTEVHNLSKITENVVSVSSPENNYKSSSDSGRGTIKGFVNRNTDGISPLDLTSLDSDHSVCVSNDWHNIESSAENVTKSETIEKMQRELQRILEDNDCRQSLEVEVEDLSRNFQTRLSVVNESDSWTSNTPSQTPQLQQKATSFKYPEPKVEQKYSSVASNVLHSNAIKSKQLNRFPKEFQNSYNRTKINEKYDSSQQRFPKTTHTSNSCPKRKGRERSTYIPTKDKLRTRIKSKDRFTHPIDSDFISTTTARDSNYDELSSEYTANTSVRHTNHTFAIRKQLEGLENMYSEIIGILGSRKNGDNHNMKRKGFKSTSSVVSGRSSVTSRGTRDFYYRRSKQEFKHRYDEHSSRRIKRLESHVITLARSVAQLSTDMRSNQCLTQELENLRQDVDAIRDQFLVLKQTISSNHSISSKTIHQSNGHIWSGRRINNHIISPNKVEKLKRFFGDEPPLLRQFLKKLGYEKYARNFESEKIGISELPYLTEERMQKLGIPLGPRMRIIQESHQHLKTLSNSDNYSVYAIV